MGEERYRHGEFGEHCGAMLGYSGPTQDRAVAEGRGGFLEKITSTERIRGLRGSDHREQRRGKK